MASEQGVGSGRVVALELVVRCRACDAVVPINRFAPNAACTQCGRRVELSGDTWALLLREAAERGAGAREGDERAAVVEAGHATFRCVFRSTAAHCLACREPLPLDEIAQNIAKDAVCCVGCGARVGVRPPPIPAPGLDLVVGEELEHASGALETRTLPCGGCGAPLSFDGTQRTVTCEYCKASSAVPEELWRDLHPRREVRRWFLVFAPGAKAHAESAEWATVTDVAVDQAGNLYCVGRLDEGDAETAVWCVAPDMTLRWAKRSLAGLPHDRARLFLAARGRVGVWFPGGSVVAFLDASNGETQSCYPRRGSPQPVRVANCVELVADADGTLIALLHGPRFGGMEEHSTFIRFTEEGRVLDLWPGVPSPSPPEMGDEIPFYTDLPSQPRWIAGTPRLAVGWDGTLFVYGGNFGGLGWARIARNGFVTVERQGVDSGMRIAGDRRGWIYLLGHGEIYVTDRTTRPAWRLSATKGPAGLAEERCLAVGPDGEVTLVGNGGRLRRLGPNGAVLFASDASRRADQAGHARSWTST